MDKEALRQRLMVTFLGELQEHVHALNRDLLALEKSSDDDRLTVVTSLFRTAHSLKGAARSVNLPTIEMACHRVESLLGAARERSHAPHQPVASTTPVRRRRATASVATTEPRSIEPDAMQLLYRTADALAETGERLRAGSDPSGGSLQALLPALDEAVRRRNMSLRPAAPAASPVTFTDLSPLVPSLPAASSLPSIREGFVRVSADKLDALLAGSGELLIARRRAAAGQNELAALCDDISRWRSEWRRIEKPLGKLLQSQRSLLPPRAATTLEHAGERLKTIERRIERLSSAQAAHNHRLDRAAATLDDEIRRVRMFPFNHACEGLDRAVRDLAHGTAKNVDLVVHGGEVELDRFVLDSLKDPLLHLIRNAIDHGVEPPAERRARGKSPRAIVTVAASLRSNEVEIVVEDDGRGLDLVSIREHARRKHIVIPEDDRDAARLIFMPGFSTAPLLTELSGRGMGLDVVKHHVESLHGHVDFAFEPGRGARVVLTVPLTLTTIRALLLSAGGHVFALPLTNVRRLMRLGARDLASIGGREVLIANDAPIPVASLTDILDIAAAPKHSAAKAPIVIMASGQAQVAVAVDELIAEEEILVKNLGARLRRIRHFAGATILPSGRVALILNAADIIDTVLTRAPGRSLRAALDSPDVAVRRRLLVVDDSVTTRTLEKSILEAAGYEVIVAVDGSDAWRLLQDRGADLVVTDVEMPRMDGFALCEAIRGSTRFRELPVILVTALESDEHKTRGLTVGADAYLAKSAFDQRQLLETIVQLL